MSFRATITMISLVMMSTKHYEFLILDSRTQSENWSAKMDRPEVNTLYY